CHALLYLMWDRNAATLAHADEASRRALELGPELAESHVARGLALYLASRFDEACQEFDTAVHQNPQLFEAYYHYGRVCQRQGKPAEAARLFEQASRVDPDDYQALLQLGSVYQALGRPADGEAASRLGLARAEEHLALHPDDA